MNITRSVTGLLVLSAFSLPVLAFDKMAAVNQFGKAFGFEGQNAGVKFSGGVGVSLAKQGVGGLKLKDDNNFIGFKGYERLGNGYAALFNLEATFRGDDGSGAYQAKGNSFGFNRSSYLGLVTPVGLVRLGRAGSPLASLIYGKGYANGMGRGVGTVSSSFPGGGLNSDYPELSPYFNNGLFFDTAVGPVSFGAAVTTKGTQFAGIANSTRVPAVDNEGKKGTKSSSGAYVSYATNFGPVEYKIGAAYQYQNGTYVPSSSKLNNGYAEMHSGVTLVSSVKYGSVRLLGALNRNRFDNNDLVNAPAALPSDPLREGTTKSAIVNLGFDLTPTDYIYATYGQYSRKQNVEFITAGTPTAAFANAGQAISGYQVIRGRQISLGYEHKLSKRTVVYTNVSLVKTKQSCALKPIANTALTTTIYNSTCPAVIKSTDDSLAGEVGWRYDVGVTHSF